jgi:hypothetical protein
MTNLELLERECKASYNGLMNAILNRKDHPTYGYTKKDILERLAFMEGLLYAYHVMKTGEASGSHLLQVREACENILERDIDNIRAQAAAA